ncbi:hypothetical protein KM043_015436 [Ampulex compressa]|nr:hypothetical protein KM043_015436 [Ampulex compressa]
MKRRRGRAEEEGSPVEEASRGLRAEQPPSRQAREPTTEPTILIASDTRRHARAERLASCDRKSRVRTRAGRGRHAATTNLSLRTPYLGRPIRELGHDSFSAQFCFAQRLSTFDWDRESVSASVFQPLFLYRIMCVFEE